jgi:hypothetical protein
VTHAQWLERKARRSQLEAAMKTKTTKSFAKKKGELTEKAHPREKSAKESAKAVAIAVPKAAKQSAETSKSAYMTEVAEERKSRAGSGARWSR